MIICSEPQKICVPATNTGLHFLWLGTNVGQSLKPNFMRFIARASGLSAHLFLIFAQGLKKKLTQNVLFLIHSKFGQLV